MNKKKLTVLALLLVVVVVMTSCLFVACNDNNNPDANDTNKTIEATKDLLINNGDFKVVDTAVSGYPRSVTSWTGAKMYSSSSFRDDVTAGVISLENALYNANKSKWKDDDSSIYNLLTAGGRYGDDDEIKNALMIYMPETSKNADGNDINGPTAYGYTSSSFTLQKGAYYKLSVDVLTHNIAGSSDDADAEKGARIYVSSNTYAELSGIVTNDEWKTYEIYFETSPSSSTSLSVMLGLGKYNSYYTKGLTSGYAFFDNLKLEKIEDKAETPAVEGKVAFDAAREKELAGNKEVATTTLKVSNGDFKFGTTSISSSAAPSNWSQVTGGSSAQDDLAPTSLGYNGIIDVTKFTEGGEGNENYRKYSGSYVLKGGSETQSYVPAINLDRIKNEIVKREGLGDSKVYMLSQQLMTAQGIKSSRTITIEKNKFYAISVDIFTFGVHGAGASLILTGSDGKNITIKGISANKSTEVYIGGQAIDINNQSLNKGEEEVGNSTGKWETFVFYVQGNQYRDFNYNMEVWLGTDGTKDNNPIEYHSYSQSGTGGDKTNATTYDANHTFSNGWVFVDNLNVAEQVRPADFDESTLVDSENNELDCSASAKTKLFVDLTKDNLFLNGGKDILSQDNASNAPSQNSVGVTAIGYGAPNGFTSTFKADDASQAVIGDIVREGVVSISNKTAFDALNLNIGEYPGMPYSLAVPNAYVIFASAPSTYQVDTTKFTVEANKFYRISVWVKTVDVKKSSGVYVYLIDKSEGAEDAELASFTKVNTKDYDEYLNDWCELTFIVRGAKDKSNDVALRFALGTGNRWASSTLTDGAGYFSNVNVSELTYANFKNTNTSTYVKTYDFSTKDNKSYTFTNGYFANVDIDDENFDSSKGLLQDQDFAISPENWTVSDKTLEINKADKNLYAGVIALTPTDDGLDYNTSHQAETVTGLNASVFNNLYTKPDKNDSEYFDLIGSETMLAIGGKNGEEAALGFESDSFTLTANTYYALSVLVHAEQNTTFSAYLTGEVSATGNNLFKVTETEAVDGFTKYTFYIEVGDTSASVKLNLWLGVSKQFTESSDDSEAEDIKSAGHVFFNKVQFNSIDEEKYNAAVASDTAHKLSFMTDSFDSLTSSIESRSGLTAPNGWTGAADTNQKSENTKGGVLYADENFYGSVEVSGKHYVKILGKEYKEEDDEFNPTTEEFNTARADEANSALSDDEITSMLRKQKFDKTRAENWLPVDSAHAKSGNRMLVINNMTNSAYKYTTSTSKTFKENNFYKVSVSVRTYGLSGEKGDDTIGASIELYLGSANENDKPLIFKSIKADEWTTYTFYVKTLDEDVKNITIRLSLGYYETTEEGDKTVVKGLTKGYAMFDDVTVETVSEEEYLTADANEQKPEGEKDNTIKARQVIADTAGKAENPTNPTEPTKPGFNLNYLWWMIPTIVIGLVIIVVVIVFVIRKVRKGETKKIVKKATAPTKNPEVLDEKRNRYDDNKE